MGGGEGGVGDDVRVGVGDVDGEEEEGGGGGGGGRCVDGGGSEGGKS